MTLAKRYDIAIIGGGIVGVATARALTLSGGRSVVLLEAESSLGAHQTGNNSGVIHSGLYYRPRSLKARNCVEGRAALYAYCEERGLPFERCGKIVVAVDDGDLPALAELERRGHENGLTGVRRIDSDELRELEPHAQGVAGLHVPETGIVDYLAVLNSFADDARENGAEFVTDFRLTGAHRVNDGWALESEGEMIDCGALVNCAGLQCDRVARMCGARPDVRIVPFRGEYYELAESRRALVRNLIYPVPDPRFPFLGVHFTRMIGGGVEAGPNAVLAFRREGYRRRDISPVDMWDYLTYGGFWRMATKFWRVGAGEFHRSLSKGAFVRALQRLMPSITASDITRGGAGVRAQALGPDGALLDDFHILEGERMIHVLNAPSPAATASMAIGRTIAELARKRFVD